MYDPGTKQLVWTGRATKMKNLHKAIAKLLKNHPPKQK
jgi:hypothetical protein